MRHRGNFRFRGKRVSHYPSGFWPVVINARLRRRRGARVPVSAGCTGVPRGHLRGVVPAHPQQAEIGPAGNAEGVAGNEFPARKQPSPPGQAITFGDRLIDVVRRDVEPARVAGQLLRDSRRADGRQGLDKRRGSGARVERLGGEGCRIGMGFECQVRLPVAQCGKDFKVAFEDLHAAACRTVQQCAGHVGAAVSQPGDNRRRLDSHLALFEVQLTGFTHAPPQCVAGPDPGARKLPGDMRCRVQVAHGDGCQRFARRKVKIEQVACGDGGVHGACTQGVCRPVECLAVGSAQTAADGAQGLKAGFGDGTESGVSPVVRHSTPPSPWQATTSACLFGARFPDHQGLAAAAGTLAPRQGHYVAAGAGGKDAAQPRALAGAAQGEDLVAQFADP